MTPAVKTMLRRHRGEIAVLRKLADEGDLIPFIGAGTSCGLRLPGWPTFLKQCAERAGIGAEVSGLLESNEYPQAASLLDQRLGPGRLQELIREAYGDDRIRGTVVKEPLTLLPHLSPDRSRGVIATTNFDNVLEAIFDAVGKPLSARHIGAAMRYGTVALVYNQRHLLKLHGTNEREADRILTAEEYRAAYGGLSSEDVKIDFLLPFLMVEMLASKRALFVGCSLGNDLTMQLLQSIFRKTRTEKHFALMEVGRSDEMQVADRLSQAGIRPIWYPHGAHDEAITAILRAILPGQQPSRPAGRVFEVCGLLALTTSLVSMVGFQTHVGHDPGPRYLVIGLPAIAILELVLLIIATRFSTRTPSLRVTQRLMPGFGAPMRGLWSSFRWFVWLVYVAIPLYACGHFVHMQKHLKIVRLPTPEFGYHERVELGWGDFFRWSSVDFGMLLDGRPHYRWAVDTGAQAYPFIQPWLQTILAVAAIALGIIYTIRCVTGWGCNQLRTEVTVKPEAFPDGRVDLPDNIHPWSQ